MDEEKYRVHALRFDYKFVHMSPYNSTEERGILFSLRLLSQLANRMLVQYKFDL